MWQAWNRVGRVRHAAAVQTCTLTLTLTLSLYIYSAEPTAHRFSSKNLHARLQTSVALPLPTATLQTQRRGVARCSVCSD